MSAESAPEKATTVEAEDIAVDATVPVEENIDENMIGEVVPEEPADEMPIAIEEEESPMRAVGSSVVKSVTFNKWATGAYTATRVGSDWPGADQLTGATHMTIRTDSNTTRNKVLSVVYKAGQLAPAGGALFRWKMPYSYDELYVSYYVKFGSSFIPMAGGKLPGLGGGETPSGCVAPVSTPSGFSARYMWNGRPGTTSTSSFFLTQYMYGMDRGEVCGDHYAFGAHTIQRGRWYRIEQRIRMNKPTSTDWSGLVQTWVDGKLVQQKTGIRLRANRNYGVDAFLFSTFFGGSTNNYRPPTDQRIDFDDFVFSTAR